MDKVSLYKRCGCRAASGRPLGAACPKLKRGDGKSWNPRHGTWTGKAELPAGPDGQRIILHVGGFARQDDLEDWFREALALLAIPEQGPDGHAARCEILGMIRTARKAKAALPDHDGLQRRYQARTVLQPGSTGAYLRAWLDQLDADGDLAATTRHGYRRAIERLFLPALDEIPLERLTAAHIHPVFRSIDEESERIRAARASADAAVRASVAGRVPTTAASKARYLAVLRSALADAASGEHPLIVANPAAGVRFGSKGKARGSRKRTTVRALLWTAEREAAWRAWYQEQLAAEDIKAGSAAAFRLWRRAAGRPGRVMVWMPAHLGAFLDATEEDRLHHLYSLCGHCGFRRGEGVGLPRTHLDFAALTILVASSIVEVGYEPVTARPKTDGSMAHVKVDPEDMTGLRAVLDRQVQERAAWGPAWTDSGLVFTREDGQPYHPQHVSGRFERLAFAAGLPPICCKDLRHTAATIALAGGADITAVSRMLRHSSITITADIYTEVLPELAAEVSSTVVRMIPRKRRSALGSDSRSHLGHTSGSGGR